LKKCHVFTTRSVSEAEFRGGDTANLSNGCAHSFFSRPLKGAGVANVAGKKEKAGPHEEARPFCGNCVNASDQGSVTSLQ